MGNKFTMKGMFNLEDRKPVPCEDLLAHAAWMEEHWRDCVVGADQFADCDVHTCFLGMDLRSALSNSEPVLFETAVFRGADREGGILEIWRYATWAEAEAGHASLVKKYSGRG